MASETPLTIPRQPFTIFALLSGTRGVVGQLVRRPGAEFAVATRGSLRL
jgi:hypothetical protein